MESELLGAGQDESPHPLVLIHNGLKVGKQVGAALDLIKDRTVRITGQKSPGIGVSKGADIRIFQRHISFAGENRPRKCRLARLARSGNGHNGKSLAKPENCFGCFSLDHIVRLTKLLQIVNSIYNL